MKKMTSIFLILALIFATAIPVFSASEDNATLEKAIIKVKSIIQIPADATEFEYNTWEDPEFGTIWNLNWNDKNYESSYNVSIDESGRIINYYGYTKAEITGIGTVSREQGQKIAEAFLQKVLASGIGDIKLNQSETNESQLSYSYDLYKNGYLVNYASFNVDVDRHSGQVVGYYGYNQAMNSKDEFPVVSNPIGKEKAKEAYLSSAGIKLTYNAYYDWAKRELSIFPAYVYTANSQYIDAGTGKLIKEFNGQYYPMYGAKGGGGATASDAAESLTPGEQQVVDQVAGLLAKETAMTRALDLLPNKPTSTKLIGASLSKSNEEGNYIWNFDFEKCNVRINAKSGELISFYLYSESQESGRTVSKETAEKTALAWIQKVAADKFKDTAFSESMSYTEIPTKSLDGKILVEKEPYRFVYTRVVNGIEFTDNSIAVSVDSATGEITQYTLSWYDNVKFPSVEGVIGAEKAFEAVESEMPFDLLYIKVEQNKAAMAYGFRNMPAFWIDPFTGEKLGRDGKSYQSAQSVSGYDDIDGKWYAETVNKLLDSGYYLSGTSFNGASEIKQEDFLRYLYSPSQSWYDQDAFYDMLSESKIVHKEEKAPESVLSRQDAAKFAVRYLGLDKAAKDGSIFKQVYQDTIDPAYQGYAALAKAIGIMSGDMKGNFNGAKAMSRAESAVVIHNVLQNK